jgi:hypothetical protein
MGKQRLLNGLAVMTFLAAMVVVAWWALGTCGCHDGCDPEATRCHKNRVEICDHDNDWDLVLDCDRVEPGDWECCPDGYYADAHGCVLVGDCGADAGADGGGP